MPNLKQALLAVLLALGALAALPAAEIFVVNSASRTLSRIDTETGSVNNSFAQLGLSPNLMDLDAERIYIACSGDNAIQMVDRASGAHLRYIPVAASANPYDVLKVGDFLYVSGLFTNKVYKLSLAANAVVASLDVGTAPEGLCTDGERLYVCNTGGYPDYAQSGVSVIDLATFTVTATVPTWTNPQFAVARGNHLHVSCTGNWNGVSGKLDIIDLKSLTLAARLDVGGNPGSLWIGDDGVGYIGEGDGNALYRYDADTFTLEHGAADPLNYEASMISGNASLIALLKQNWASNSLVRVYNPELALLNWHEVGLSSSDIVVAPPLTSVEDEHCPATAAAIYPNPVTGGRLVRINNGKAGELRLYNVKGQLLLKRGLGKGENSVDLGSLPAGVYLYKLDAEGRGGKLLVAD